MYEPRSQLIRKKIIYLTDRVQENPLLQPILDEYIHLQTIEEQRAMESVRQLIPWVDVHEKEKLERILSIQ